MTIGQWKISAPSQSIVTTAVTFSGKDAFYSTTSAPATLEQLPGGQTNGRATGATTILAQSVNILNSSSNVARLSEDGVAITGANYVTEFTVEIANNLRQREAVGFLGAISLSQRSHENSFIAWISSSGNSVRVNNSLVLGSFS